jgi:hypothetical protein
MRESRKEVRSYRVTLTCDCGAEMKATGMVYSTYPEQIEYQCSICGIKSTSTRRYPYTTYEDMEGGAADGPI